MGSIEDEFIFNLVHCASMKAFLVPPPPSALDIFEKWAQGADPPTLPLSVATAGKNHLNEEINPLLPPGIGEGCSQTVSNVRHAALLRRCELSL